LGCSQQSSDVIEGKVIAITDGDTIKILYKGEPLRIRLVGVDCPEKTQAYGTKAKQFTASLAAGKTVKVLVQGKDMYQRTLGEVILPDGVNLNEALVRNGFAWKYKYTKSVHLEQLQKEAKEKHKGLWQGTSPLPPWEFRKLKKHRKRHAA